MFNDEFLLTKSVIDGRKTQTRRIVPQSVIDKYSMLEDFTIIDDARYDVGEIVAIAQSYKDVDSYYSAAYQRQHSIHGMTVDALDCVSNKDIMKWFKNRNDFKDKASWNNKMFVKSELMPHQIRITDVRVERLQDISDEDCLKEGITDMGAGGSLRYSFTENVKQTTGDIIAFSNNFATAKEAFAHLINKVSRKDVWNENPYVFVYDFELVK